ncbi:hypothetical protein CEXT_815251 [Caerostris extrusa]|uniref:Uncharacterized protein n=1 Tax=Caerostris extrusa TaxID=172846 RepID=A0AAV4RWZ6_CAEEX|nr:hypothetical protein CEXT_815251 [Caerostris extrusa]
MSVKEENDTTRCQLVTRLPERGILEPGSSRVTEIPRDDHRFLPRGFFLTEEPFCEERLRAVMRLPVLSACFFAKCKVAILQYLRNLCC